MFLMLIVVSSTLAVAVGAFARSAQRDGTAWWASGLALYTVAYLLYGLRGHISDLYSVVLANVALLGVTAIFAEGLLQFQQRRVSRWWFWPAVPLTAFFFTLFLGNLTYRIIVGSMLTAIQCTIVLVILLQRHDQTVGRGKYFVATGLLAAIAVFAYRALVTAVQSTGSNSHFEQGAVGTATFLVSVVSLILLALGFVLMTKERADERNQRAAAHDEPSGTSQRGAAVAALAPQPVQPRDPLTPG